MPERPQRTLVLGGTRSGKSAFAEAIAAELGDVRYIATARARPGDREWAARITAHRARRPASWETIESDDPAAAIAAARSVTVVDDVAVWLSQVMDDADAWSDTSRAEGSGLGSQAPWRAAIERAVDDLAAAVAAATHPVVIVSSEVGLGGVDPDPGTRRFADQLGRANQRLAAACTEVFLVVAGIPLRLDRA